MHEKTRPQTKTHCPTPEVLKNFTTGMLSPEASEAIAEHIADCPHCLEHLETLDQSADPLTQELRHLSKKVPPEAIELHLNSPHISAPSIMAAEFAPLNASLASPEGLDTNSPDETNCDLDIECPYCRHRIELQSASTAHVVRCSSCSNRFTFLSGSDQKNQATRIAHFELIEHLGEGSFGTVWKAMDISLNRAVALKIPRIGTTNQMELFTREARAAAQLRHPNIVQVHEVSQEANVAFIASQYIDGMSLKQATQEQQPTSRKAAQILLTLAHAVAAAHEAGVIHRDLTPANILIDSDGNPHITDFGIAKNKMADFTVTNDGKLIGTPMYMSPEQARGQADQVDARSDIYSLGVILFELISGIPPFRGDLQAIITQILLDDPPRPRLLNSRIPRDLETISLKCLEKKPSRRYQSATELALDLERFIEGRSISARRPSPVLKLARWSKRNPLITSLLCLLFLCAVVSSWAIINAYRKVSVAYQTSLSAEAKTEAALATAQNNLHLALHNIYTAQISMGYFHWLANDLVDMEYDLKQCPDELRNIEWGYLSRLRHSATHTLHDAGGSLDFSPDGKFLVTAGGGYHNLRVWDITSGEQVFDATRHKSHISGIDCSTDGRFIVSCGGDDHQLLLWDTQKDYESRVLATFQGSVSKALFTPDNKQVIVTDKTNTLKICDIDTLESRSIFDAGDKNIIDIDLDPTQPHLVIILGKDRNKTAHIWNYETEEPVSDIPHGEGEPSRVAYSPDGSYLAISENMRALQIWKTEPFTLLQTIAGPLGMTSNIAFSPNSNRVAVQMHDESIRILNPISGAELNRFRGIRDRARSICFSPDGEHLAVGADDDIVRVWQTSTPQGAIQLQTASGSRVRDIKISPCGRYLAAASEADLTVWAIEHYSKLWEITDLDTIAADLNFSPDGEQFVVGLYDGGPQIIDSASGELLATNTEHNNRVYSVQFSPNGAMVASAQADGKILFWDPATGKTIKQIETSSEELRNVDLRNIAFSPDGTQLATGDTRGRLTLWDVGSGEMIWKQHRPKNLVYDVQWLPDGSRIVASYNNGHVSLHHPQSGKEIGWLKQNNYSLSNTKIAFSPDGSRLFTATERLSIRIWDPDTKQMILEMYTDPYLAQAIAIHPDGHTIAAGHLDGRILIWSVDTFREQH